MFFVGSILRTISDEEANAGRFSMIIPTLPSQSSTELQGLTSCRMRSLHVHYNDDEVQQGGTIT